MEKKKITFINQRAPWKLVVGGAGILVLIITIIDSIRNEHSSVFMLLAMLLLYVPIIYPLKFKDYVRFQKNLVSFKLGKQKTQNFRPDHIHEIELFKEKMIIWTGKKKFIKVNTMNYSNEDILILVDILEGKPAVIALKSV